MIVSDEFVVVIGLENVAIIFPDRVTSLLFVQPVPKSKVTILGHVLFVSVTLTLAHGVLVCGFTPPRSRVLMVVPAAVAAAVLAEGSPENKSGFSDAAELTSVKTSVNVSSACALFDTDVVS